MTVWLLDANLLIALTVAEHEHHDRAATWVGNATELAVSPVIEGALVRFLLRLGESADTARLVLSAVRNSPRCRFWEDSVSYLDADLSGVTGHRQVTDSYLVSLARHHGGRLATFDRALAARHDDVLLVP